MIWRLKNSKSFQSSYACECHCHPWHQCRSVLQAIRRTVKSHCFQRAVTTIAAVAPYRRSCCVIIWFVFLLSFLIVSLSLYFIFFLEIWLKLRKSRASIVQMHNGAHCPLQLDGGWVSDTPTARGGELFEAAFYVLFLVKLSRNVAVRLRQESHSSGQFHVYPSTWLDWSQIWWSGSSWYRLQAVIGSSPSRGKDDGPVF